MKRRTSPRVAFAAILALLMTAAGAFAAQAAPRSAGTATQTVYPAFYETFSNRSWYQNWGMVSAPWHTTAESDEGNPYLKVHIAKGDHDGTSFFKATSTLDAVTMRYRIRFHGFDPSMSQHNVKLPGFGAPLLGPGGVCLAGCGGAAGDGLTAYSARADVQDTGVPGFYVYDAYTRPLAYGRGIRWNATPFRNDRWYDVEIAIAMNTPDVADGVLRAKVNGQTVFDRRDFLFRRTSTLHVGSAWFDFYYGGTGVAPADTSIDIDDVMLYVGVLP